MDSYTKRLVSGEVMFVPREGTEELLTGWYTHIKTTYPGLFFHRVKDAQDGVPGYRIWVDDVAPQRKFRSTMSRATAAQ